MDVREKLVKLIESARYWGSNTSEEIAENLISNGVTVQDNTEISEELLQQLRNAPLTILHEEPTIEVVQEWISVKDRLPQEDEPVDTICDQVQVLLSDGFVTTGWCNRSHKAWYYLPYGDTHFIGDGYKNTPVIAWQPMAEPPKGE